MASNKQTRQVKGSRLQAAGNSLFFVFVVIYFILGITQLQIKPKDKFLNTSGGYNPQFAGLQFTNYSFLIEKKKEKKNSF